MTDLGRCAAVLLTLALVLAIGGCASRPPFDYSVYAEHPPRSILILPPLNETTTVEGTASYLSTVTQPVAEHGYYVFPVAVVARLLRENGMPTPGEMHEIPLAKVLEVTGADAVLYPVLHAYGSKYHLVSSDTIVSVSARLVDTRTGTLLWSGSGIAQQGTNGSGNIVVDLIAAAVAQAVNSSRDVARPVCRVANAVMFDGKNQGLPFGPYRPDAGRHP